MIEVRELCFSYGKNQPLVLDHVSCRLEPGHCVAILGNNGAGKSTLLKCINRIQRPGGGSVTVDGQALDSISRRQLARQIAFVPQRSEPSDTMVFDAVLLGRKPYIKWDVTAEDKQIVAQLLEQMQLTDHSTRYLSELSGGELQKVVLARALAQQPRYLLLDEPTSSLDPRNQNDMLDLLREISRAQKIGVAVVIHDLNLALRFCDRFLFLRESRVYADGDLSIVTPETIEAVYGMRAEILEHKGRKLVVPL